MPRLLGAICVHCFCLVLCSGPAHSRVDGKENGGASICAHFAEDHKILNLMKEQGLPLDAILYIETLQKRYRDCSPELTDAMLQLEKTRSVLYFNVTLRRSFESLSKGRIIVEFTDEFPPKEQTARESGYHALMLSGFSSNTLKGIAAALEAERKWKQLSNVRSRLKNWILIGELLADAKSFSLAEKLLERVVAYLSGCYPREKNLILWATLFLAQTRDSMGYRAGGESAVLSLVEKLEGARGPNPTLALIYRMVASYYFKIGRKKVALSWLDRVIRADQYVWHPCHEERVKNERDFAALLYQEGFKKKSLDFYDDCIDGKLQSTAESCLDGAVGLLASKGILLGENHEYERGKKALSRALALIDQGANPRLSEYWAGNKALINAYRAMFVFRIGQEEEAIRMARGTIDDLRTMGLESTYYSITAHEALVYMLQNKGDNKGATIAAKVARETLQRCCPEQQSRYIFIIDIEAKAFRCLGKKKQAEKLEKESRVLRSVDSDDPKGDGDIQRLLPEINKLLTEPLPKCAVNPSRGDSQ